jgi:hypothetical protein
VDENGKIIAMNVLQINVLLKFLWLATLADVTIASGV